MRTLLQRYFVADATQKRRSMSQATCFLVGNYVLQKMLGVGLQAFTACNYSEFETD